MKTTEQKNTLLEQLLKTPIVQITCERAGISRATYYRWRKEDAQFAKSADEAIAEGSLFINDMAESQLISAIKDKNLSAIIFWLRNHHASYASKLEVTGRLRLDEALTPEQEALITQALKLAALNIPPKNEEK